MQNSWWNFPVIIANFLFAAGLVGCATGSPGAPMIRGGADDGFGPLIPNCQNVSPSTPYLPYQSKFYLSTWTSAVREGAQTGLQAGLEIEPGDRSRAKFTKKLSGSVLMRAFGHDGSHFPFRPYCMFYRSPPEKVRSALSSILPKLQNPIIKDEEDLGVFGTDFLDREHPAAKWKDRYIILVRESPGGGSEVDVYRDLWISRQGSPYAQAESNGGNEAWILVTVARALK